MASITINNLDSAANINNVINNAVPIYQGNDNDGDTFKIAPLDLVKQSLNIPNSGGSEGKYLNQQGRWTVPPDNNTTYGLATLNDPGLMSTAQVQTLNSFAGKDQPASEQNMGWMSANDKAKLNQLTTAVASTGAKGYFPQLSGRGNEFLNGQGNWVTVEGTTYGIASTDANGLMSKDNVSQLSSAYAHAVTNKGSSYDTGLYKIKTNSEGHVVQAAAVTKADITGLGIPGTDTNTTYALATSSASGLMSSAQFTKLKNLPSEAATTATNGLMSAEDKEKVDLIKDMWAARPLANSTETDVQAGAFRYQRIGDIVILYCNANLSWKPVDYFRIPEGCRPVYMSHMVAPGIVYGSDYNLKGFLRINCEMHQTTENNTTVSRPHLCVGAFDMAGNNTTVHGLGNFVMTWGTTDSYAAFINTTGATITTYARTSI